MDIVIIRHADPNYQKDCITEVGHKQAERLSEYIERLHVDEIYVSPMGRANETASYCLKKWNKTAVTLPWLRELIWGDASGDAYATESPWVMRDTIIDKDGKYPEGESWKLHNDIKNDRLVSDVEARNKSFDDFLKEQGYERKGQLYDAVKPNSKTIAFFCHSGLASCLISHALNIPFWQFITHFDLGLTSVSVLHFKTTLGARPATASVINDMADSYN